MRALLWLLLLTFHGREALGWLGGNVVITLKAGYNLPDLDGYGPIAGETDAYVKVRRANALLARLSPVDLSSSAFITKLVHPICASSGWAAPRSDLA